MTYETILATKDAHALTIQFNRPDKRNAISWQMIDEIIHAMKAAEKDPEVAGVIIYGGASYFAAGADLNEALSLKTSSDVVDCLKRWHRLNATIEELAKPVIAAIEGWCMTGGLEIALACDLRVAAEGSTYAITSSKIGTVAGAGGTQRLPRIIGVANALELLLSAETIDVKEAHRVGLVNKVSAKGGALDAAKQIVKVYATRAPRALALVKRAVYRGIQMDLASSLELESYLAAAAYETEDRKEGISAFLEKRTPSFKGR